MSFRSVLKQKIERFQTRSVTKVNLQRLLSQQRLPTVVAKVSKSMIDVSGSSLSLEQCAEYHRIHSAPVPVKAHFTCIVFSTLVVVALVWLAMTMANVVVRGTGRMRPIANEKGMEAVSEKINSEVSSRIQAVYVVENQAVSKGQVLVEIDTHQVEHQIDLKKVN